MVARAHARNEWNEDENKSPANLLIGQEFWRLAYPAWADADPDGKAYEREEDEKNDEKRLDETIECYDAQCVAW